MSSTTLKTLDHEVHHCTELAKLLQRITVDTQSPALQHVHAHSKAIVEACDAWESMRQQLEQLFAVDGGLWPDDYRQAIGQNQLTSYRLMADIINSLSDKQRSKMQRELRDLASDFIVLANS